MEFYYMFSKIEQMIENIKDQIEESGADKKSLRLYDQIKEAHTELISHPDVMDFLENPSEEKADSTFTQKEVFSLYETVMTRCATYFHKKSRKLKWQLVFTLLKNIISIRK